MEQNQIVQDSFARLRQRFILINKIRIRTWQGTLIIGFAAGFAAALMWSISQQWTNQLIAAVSNADLRINPSSGNFTIGDEFDANIVLNTNGQNVVAVGAYLTFDPISLQVVGIDYKNSVFPAYWVEDVYDNTDGVIKITRGEPAPGINTTQGIIATVRFKALAVYGSPLPNFRFVTATSKGKVKLPASSVHLDDGFCPPSGPCTGATDILGSAQNAAYTITMVTPPPQPPTPKPTPPTPENIRVEITMEGKARYNKVIILQILEKDTENIVKTITITPGQDGKGIAQASNLEKKLYDLRIKADVYLSRKLTDVSLPNEDVEFKVPKLLAGNLQDDDDTINSLDWSIMNGKWGTDDPVADINEDKIINSLDWSIMNTNWGKSGDS